MTIKTFSIETVIWRYSGKGGWHFVTLGKPLSDKINAATRSRKAAWGSVRVTVTVGQTTWQTSLFPSSEHDSYLLPIKAAVRKKENLTVDDLVRLSIDVVAIT